MIIRDATAQEKEELKIIAEETVKNMAENEQNQDIIISRCSILGGMTPRMDGMINIGDDLDNSYFQNENDKS